MFGLSEIGRTLIDKVSRGTWGSAVTDPSESSLSEDDNGNSIAMSIQNFQSYFAPIPPDWTSINEDLLMNILIYVNYSDLLECRCVCRRFQSVISNSQHFLQSTLLVTSVKPGFDTATSFLETIVPFENARFDYLDYDVFMLQKTFDALASGNYYFRPPVKFLNNLTSLEFQNCFITWETIKRVLLETPKLEELALSKCKFSERSKRVANLDEFSEFRVGKVMTNLKSFRMNEYVNDLKPINKFMEKFLGYGTTSLVKIQFSIDPMPALSQLPSEQSSSTSSPSSPKKDEKMGALLIPEFVTPTIESDDIKMFCNQMRQLLENNSTVLKTLSVDIKQQTLLNVFISSVLGSLEDLWNELNLEEFIFSPIGSCSSANFSNVDITENSILEAEVLMKFLESQKHLKKIALPHFRNLGSKSEEGKAYRRKIGACVTKSLKYLCVPNQEYLPSDFPSRFYNLKKLFIGGSTGDDERPVALHSDTFNNSIHPIFNNSIIDDAFTPVGSSRIKIGGIEAWDQYKEIGIGSTIINGIELTRIIKNFHFLTKFEVTSKFPVVQDDDMQCIVENLHLLRDLSVGACDFLTDFGVTGILRNSCEMMIRLGNYYDVSDSILESRNNPGKPLSNLKGLKNLVLMGNSLITDAGVNFGLRFMELQSACLPYNENITEWGIKKFGEHNPSLQSFVLCSVNDNSKEGFLELKKTHPRLKANKCIYLGYVNDNKPNDFSSSLMKFDVLNNNVSAMSGLCSTFALSWLFGKTAETESSIHVNSDIIMTCAELKRLGVKESEMESNPVD